jgi:hypothetical protein
VPLELIVKLTGLSEAELKDIDKQLEKMRNELGR